MPVGKTRIIKIVDFDPQSSLLERDGTGDREKAASLLDEALQTSSNLDIGPLMERVMSRRDILT